MPPIFPGIDPYLEAQGYWPDFHGRAINYCCEAIADLLPDHYEARLDERIRLVGYPDEATKAIRPDVAVTRRAPVSERQVEAVAVLEVEPVSIPAIIFEEVRDTYIQIIHRLDRKLISVIEVLSPDNKIEPGHGQYLGKLRDLYRRQVHTIEIDFLSGGHRIPMRHPLPPGDAFVIVSRWDRRPDCDVYAWSIRQKLPRVKIPLLAPDPDIVLDLAAVYATTFERGRYARSIDYSAPLAIGLLPEDRAWAEALAKQASR